MFDMKSKITRHSNKPENVTYNLKNKTIETDL